MAEEVIDGVLVILSGNYKIMNQIEFVGQQNYEFPKQNDVLIGWVASGKFTNAAPSYKYKKLLKK